MKKLIVPNFESEAEEAKWWDDHMDIVEENMVEAIENGTAKVLTRERLLERIRQSSRQGGAAVSISLAKADIEIAQRQASEKDLPYEAYIATLVHEALQQRETTRK
jgi:predicted DNA binding CopG/RHH family protein